MGLDLPGAAGPTQGAYARSAATIPRATGTGAAMKQDGGRSGKGWNALCCIALGLKKERSVQMIAMSNWYSKAVQKLEAEKKAVAGKKETIMAGPVLAVVMDFCRQEEEFAQAVAQGGTFVECMKAVANGVGSSISDIDAYKKAVNFYFPGAKVQMQLTVDLIGDAAAPIEETKPETKTALILDLADFL